MPTPELNPEFRFKTSRVRTRTLYVGNKDESIWLDVIRFCKANNVSLSTFVADALRYYFARVTRVDE